MLVATTEQGLVIAQPRSFTGLMTLYESNYIRLKRLLGDPRTLRGAHVSHLPGDPDLHLQVVEQTRYTTVVQLTYWFEDAGPEPDLLVRVYHDARMAEAAACGRHDRHAVLRGFATTAPDVLQQRWARNMLLNKWLDYCIEQGHVLQPIPAADNELKHG